MTLRKTKRPSPVVSWPVALLTIIVVLALLVAIWYFTFGLESWTPEGASARITIAGPCLVAHLTADARVFQALPPGRPASSWLPL